MAHRGLLRCRISIGLMTASGHERSSGDVGSMSGLPESGLGDFMSTCPKPYRGPEGPRGPRCGPNWDFWKEPRDETHACRPGTSQFHQYLFTGRLCHEFAEGLLSLL